MLKEATATGETIDEALQNAKAQLGAPYDAEIHTEILEMPKKKVLGLFGGALAKVRAYYEAPDEKPKKAPAEKKTEKKADKKPEKKAEKKAEKKVEKKAEAPVVKAEAPEKEKASYKKVEISSNEALQTAAEYLKTVVLGMGCEKAEVEAFETAENEIILELDCGEDYGIVIGRRGETLDSIQYLTRLAANRKKGENDYSRISVNVGNYREKRKQTLSELAKKNASKVRKYGRNFSFEPMNPYERRIIHTAVQEIEGVTSYSVGSDNDRRVVITLEDGVKPTHGSKGGYNRGRGGRGGRNGGRGARSNSQTVTSAPTRAPKTDAGAEGVSLYGKIN